jgi:hypothetical protein
VHEVHRPAGIGLGQWRQWILWLINAALRFALLQLKAVTIVYPLGPLVVLDKAFTLQDKMHTRAAEPRAFLQDILHSVENLMVLSWPFLVPNGGTIRSYYLAGPTLTGAEGFLNKLDGLAFVVRP